MRQVAPRQFLLDGPPGIPEPLLGLLPLPLLMPLDIPHPPDEGALLSYLGPVFVEQERDGDDQHFQHTEQCPGPVRAERFVECGPREGERAAG